MRTIDLAGVPVPVIGQGTWRMGEDPGSAALKSPRCNWGSTRA